MKKTYDIFKDGHPYILDLVNKKDAVTLYKQVWDTFKPRVLKLFVNETITHELYDNMKESPKWKKNTTIE